MSKLEQLTAREPTHTLTTRIDGRYLATLILFWREQGELPKSISELTRLSLESFTEFLVENHMVTFVEDMQDALEIMEGTSLRPKTVNTKHLAKKMSAQSPTTNFLTSPDPAHSHRKRTKDTPVSSVEIDQAMAAMQKLDTADLESRAGDARRRTEEFVKGLAQPPTTESEKGKEDENTD